MSSTGGTTARRAPVHSRPCAYTAAPQSLRISAHVRCGGAAGRAGGDKQRQRQPLRWAGRAGNGGLRGGGRARHGCRGRASRGQAWPPKCGGSHRPRAPAHADVRVSPGHGWAGADARRPQSAHRGRAALRAGLCRSEGLAGCHAERFRAARPRTRRFRSISGWRGPWTKRSPCAARGRWPSAGPRSTG